MEFDFENELKSVELIKTESRATKLLGLICLISVAIYFLIAAFVKTEVSISFRTVQNIWGVFNVIAITIIVLILGIRRTIYFSPRLFRSEVNLQTILKRWRTIDIMLMVISELIAILGLFVSLLGMPLKQTFHFFVCSVLLIMILMPFTFKVKDKLRIFARNAGKFPEL